MPATAFLILSEYPNRNPVAPNDSSYHIDDAVLAILVDCSCRNLPFTSPGAICVRPTKKHAALEHHRLGPLSEAYLLYENPFAAFTRPFALASLLSELFKRVDTHQASTRATAGADSVVVSSLLFDPSQIPEPMVWQRRSSFWSLRGPLLSGEDLTSIAAGVMVAQGRVGFRLAVSACLVGIYTCRSKIHRSFC